MKTGPGLIALLLLGACGATGEPNAQNMVDHAMTAEAEIAADAAARADRLDEEAQTLLTAASHNGADATEWRNQADADLAEAAAIRARGQRAGAAAKDRIEARDRLLNGR